MKLKERVMRKLNLKPVDIAHYKRAIQSAMIEVMAFAIIVGSFVFCIAAGTLGKFRISRS